MKQYAIKINVYLDGDNVATASTISSPMLDSVITDAEEQLGKLQRGIEGRVAKQEDIINEE
jgi:hypothetical protein